MKKQLLLLLLMCFVVIGGTTKTLKLIQILFRHGDRTPTDTYTNDPYRQWPGGWGSLTNKGKQQMYKLGQLLRKTYKDFLPKLYSTSSLYVRSSEADRCITSAQTLLSGLYPPVDDQIWNPNLLWQPIPVHYVPRDRDNVITMRKSCQTYTVALKSAYKSPRIQKINEDNKDLYDYVSLSTGDPMYNIHSIELLYNTLNIERSNNLTLPKWIDDVLLKRLSDLATVNYKIFTDTTLMRRLTGGAFLNEIMRKMSEKINRTSELDLVLYSGHDLTIIAITRALGFEHFSLPDYGSYVVFELYENEIEDYEIQFLYGNDFETPPKTFDLKFCPSPCTIGTFLQGYKHVLPLDWETECSTSR